jgi:hypothetical protein
MQLPPFPLPGSGAASWATGWLLYFMISGIDVVILQDLTAVQQKVLAIDGAKQRTTSHKEQIVNYINCHTKPTWMIDELCAAQVAVLVNEEPR